MAIKYIQYTKQQRINTKVSGYSMYVNSNHYSMNDSLYELQKVAQRFESQDVEIYQVLAKV